SYLLFEVLVPQFLRDRLEFLRRVDTVAGSGECVVVDVRGVDLDPTLERFESERLSEDHRRGICLFAGRTAGGPDADLSRSAAYTLDPPNDLAREELPRLRIAEERRDVDEDRVEELRELVRMDLE